MEKVEKEMIEKFQCPGCVCGMDTECVDFNKDGDNFYCKKHVPGTTMIPGGRFNLGMPKGFDKTGFRLLSMDSAEFYPIRLFSTPEGIWEANNCNLPVWARELDGYLFVRFYLPRLNIGYVHVIKNGKLELYPDAFDVVKFIDEID